MDWNEIQNEFDRAYGMSCKPSGLQKYKAGHIFDENMSVKWNRDKLEEENKKFQDEVGRLNTAKNKALLAVHELVYQKIQDDVGHNLSRTVAEKIFNYAYDDKHAYGFHEVRWELERLVELVSEILAEQKKPQRNKKDEKKNKWRPYLPRSDSTELPPVHKRMSESEET